MRSGLLPAPTIVEETERSGVLHGTRLVFATTRGGGHVETWRPDLPLVADAVGMIEAVTLAQA